MRPTRLRLVMAIAISVAHDWPGQAQAGRAFTTNFTLALLQQYGRIK